ncbi:MAG: hypothetical protein KAQ94_09160 [Arcobacteraceae bacterium]|nr:hypothetical protein [Arcobacteraceae bacterium]
MKFTVIENLEGNYAKTVNADGTKTTSAKLNYGLYTTLEVNNLKEFDEALDSSQSNHAIFLGVHDIDMGYVASSPNYNYIKNKHKGSNVTKWEGDNFKFGNEAIILFDIDVDGKHNMHFDNYQDIVDVFEELDPQFKNAEILIRPGSSSYIYKEVDGVKTQVTGAGSYHIYVMCKNVDTHLDIYKEQMINRAFELGYGYYRLSKNGSLLKRQVFDGVVFKPARPVFEAGTVCNAPFSQNRPKSFYRSGNMIDCSKLPSVIMPDALFNMRLAKNKAKGTKLKNALF